jgi:hypothetical protein
MDRVGHNRRHDCPDKTQTHHDHNFFAFLMGAAVSFEPPTQPHLPLAGNFSPVGLMNILA